MLFRVCWKSRIGKTVRTRWKPHKEALEHFKRARLRCNYDVWMEYVTNTVDPKPPMPSMAAARE